ncbi:MAG: HAMP domain-containing sensor histidine kinase [Caldilineaceae bacterium]
MLQSICWRLVASFTLLTLLTVTLLGILVLALMQRYIERQETAYLNQNAEALAVQTQRFWRAPVPPPQLATLARTAALLGNFRVKIFNANEQILADSGLPVPADQLTWVAHAPGPNRLLLPEENAFFVIEPAWLDDPVLLEKMLPPRDTAVSPPYAITVVRQASSPWGPLLHYEDGPPTSASVVMTDRITPPDVLVEAPPVKAAPTPPVEDVPPPPAVRSVTSPIRAGGGVVGYVELSNGANVASEALGALRHLFLVAAAAVSGVAVVMGLVVSRTLTAPLQELTTTTGRMNEGDLSARAQVQSSDEIGLLARSFNRMAAALESTFADLAAERDALRRFIADASHELRTPITALRTFNELLQGAAAEDAAARQEFLHEGEIQIDRLARITDNLLNLSRLEGGLVELQWAEVNLVELIDQVVSVLRPLAQERAITLVVEPPAAPVTLTCDRAQLDSALANLVENAIKFTPPGGQVQVGVEPAAVELPKAEVTLWVKDNGMGISAAELPHIFDRFYRGRTVTATGSGLGLAIVQSIAHAHGGHVTVVSQEGLGSRFNLVLPSK